MWNFLLPTHADNARLAKAAHSSFPGDLLGSLRVWFDGGAFAEAAYFTSEADARKGESSAEFSGPQQEYADLFSEMTFLDLRDPQLSGPNQGDKT